MHVLRSVLKTPLRKLASLEDIEVKVFPGGQEFDIHRACIGGLFVGGSLQSVDGDGDGDDGDGYTSYLTFI